MRICKFLICILLLFLLCGCKYSADYIDPEERYLVTSLGFEEKQNGTLVIIETMNAIEDNKNLKKIYYGFAEEVETAVKNAENMVPSNVILSLCPIILIDDSVSGDALKNVFDYCVSNYDVSLSVQLVNCKNVSEILSVESGDFLVGHKILRMLNNFKEFPEIIKFGRFSNAFAQQSKHNDFSIPHLILSENNFYIDGLSVYENYFKKQIISLKDVKEVE